MSKTTCAIRWLIPLALFFGAGVAPAQMATPEETEVEIIPLTEGLHMLRGIGGNILVSSGPDGVVIVDDDLGPMFDKILAAIRTISPGPVEMVFNTHWHFDHTGGNQAFRDQGALVVAHDNVRTRMSTPQYSGFFKTESRPSPDSALPVITFDNTATFYLNGQTIRAIHTTPAHTDGDAIFLFAEANVAHLGDVFFNGMYPLIDIEAGGSVQGMIDAIDSIVPLLNADTQIIPGHGPLGTLEDLKNFRSMLLLVSARIQILVDEGKTKEEVIILRPTFNFDEKWAWSLFPADVWTGLVYDSVVKSGTRLANGAESTPSGAND